MIDILLCLGTNLLNYDMQLTFRLVCAWTQPIYGVY